MAADESRKDSQTGSGTAQGSGQGATQPSTPYAEEAVKRTGTVENIRSTDDQSGGSTSGESGSGTSEEPDNLRNGAS